MGNAQFVKPNNDNKQTVNKDNTIQMAQSASALGATILGFGIGTKWGASASRFALINITLGATLHILGMYITQMKSQSKRTQGFAKLLWISAWICLVALIALIVYLLMAKK